MGDPSRQRGERGRSDVDRGVADVRGQLAVDDVPIEVAAPIAGAAARLEDPLAWVVYAAVVGVSKAQRDALECLAATGRTALAKGLSTLLESLESNP